MELLDYRWAKHALSICYRHGNPPLTLPIMVDLSRNHLLRPFNHFDFLGDLGLIKFKTWGAIYSAALDDLNSLEEFKRLTIALLTLVNLYHRRVQSRFPFYLGQAFSRGGKDRNTRLSGYSKTIA
uniref:Uncharacterized protein n=1 Tax=Nicotiana glauca TaxID=4090 RepID=Q40395_NICGL|nr:hypothetical protein [Nicotiana glauca]